jgi:phosphatidate cytidylyltransferase
LSEFIKRLIVAAIGIPLALFIIYAGGIVFMVAVAGLASFTLWEYYRLAKPKGVRANYVAGIAANIALIATFYYVYSQKPGCYYLIVFEMLVFAFFIFIAEMWRKRPNPLLNTAVSFTGVLYITFAFSFMIGIREFHNIHLIPDHLSFLINDSHFVFRIDKNWSAFFLIAVLGSIWACDTGAYLFGSKFGKHKLFPRISPKKSWEGSIAGFISGVLVFTLLMAWFDDQFSLHHSIIIGAIISSIGQVGDLVESMLKRDAGVKDSSAIIPGHGGFLDRFDSILAVMPPVYIYMFVFVL